MSDRSASGGSGHRPAWPGNADGSQPLPDVPLDEGDVDADPLVQLARWYEDAISAGLVQPDAMQLATVGADGQPSARTVLLKDIDERGLSFFTSYESRKGEQLATNPRCALVLLWKPLERQVNVTGVAERLPASESDEYFATRPRGSQVGAWASAQSTVIDSRASLEAALAEVEARHPGVVPRPPHWGGYLVRPETIELWKGRRNRLHDRLRYTRVQHDPEQATGAPAKGAVTGLRGRGTPTTWRLERLSP